MSYFSSQLISSNGWYDINGGNTEENLGLIFWFYATFGLWWIHSSYPNYILSDEKPTGYGPDDKVYAPLEAYDSNSANNGDPMWELADEIVANTPDLSSSDLPGTIQQYIGYTW